MNVNGYLIEEYDKYDSWDRAHTIYKFEINGVYYGVKEVQMEWGLPQLPLRINSQRHLENYCIYSDKDEAIAFARHIKLLNA